MMIRRADGKAASLTLDDQVYRRSIAFLRALQTVVPQAAARQLTLLAFDWQREIVRHMPTDEGLARNSIQVVPAHEVSGRIEAQVGTNVPYVPYLEFGWREGGHGLFAELRQWVPGSPPIRHWAAKDKSATALLGRMDTARLEKHGAASTEEFAPPFRGSWPIVAERGIRRMRKELAEALRRRLPQ